MTDHKSVIEKQKEQLIRYEKRLRDVVTAYKGLSKEKAALEASLKVLTEKSSRNLDGQSATEQKQLKVLSESLAVLSTEKSRMEANFQADKKKLRSEVEMLQNSMRDLAESEKKLKYDNESLRSKLLLEKQDKLQEQESLHHMIRDLQAQHETRVASLEAKLTELSISVGEYDRHRNADQQSILILKDQIMELENHALRPPFDNNDIEKQDSPEKKDTCSSSSEDDMHGACREQYEMILRELEHVKLLKSIKNLPDQRSQESNVEFEKLKFQNHNLHDRINSICKKLNQTENDLSLQKINLKMAVENEREKYLTEVAAMKRQHDGQLSELEDQIRQLRERSLKILEEKDTEICKLRSALKNTSAVSVLSGELSKVLNLDGDMQPEPGVKTSDNPQLFHFSQENARNVVEASILRKQNFKLEMQVRDLTKRHASTIMALQEKIEKLQHDIERLTLSQSREGANLEYLKNVVLRYLTCDDEKNRRHMLTAICTVLRFSTAESKLVLTTKK